MSAHTRGTAPSAHILILSVFVNANPNSDNGNTCRWRTGV